MSKLCVKKNRTPEEINQEINNIVCFLINNTTGDIVLEKVENFADIILSGKDRIIVVLNDINNSGHRGFYFYSQDKLDWLISQPFNY